jgi:hypothetical protein
MPGEIEPQLSIIERLQIPILAQSLHVGYKPVTIPLSILDRDC